MNTKSRCGTRSIPVRVDKMEKMVQIEAECSQHDATPMSQEELSVKVLKARSGYVKGLGMRPSSSVRIVGASVENNDHVTRLESIIEDQKQELEAPKDKIARIMEYLKQLGNGFSNIL